MVANAKNSSEKTSKRTSSPTTLSNRTMPESLEAEAAVLGSMITDNKCISEVVEQINSKAFYRL